MSLLRLWQRSLCDSAIFPRSDLSSNSISDATHFFGIGSRALASPGIVGPSRCRVLKRFLSRPRLLSVGPQRSRFTGSIERS